MSADLGQDMLRGFSPARLKAAPSREETYTLVGDAVETLSDKIKELRERLDQLEANGARFRGVYQRANSYRRGDQTTHKGSLWTALMDVPEGTAPGKDHGLWQLAAKGTG